MDWAVTQSGNRYGSLGALTASSSGTTITAPATANTKTGAAWTTVIASTDTPGNGLLLTMFNTVATIVNRLVDIGIGAAGAEQVLIPNLLFSNGIADTPATVYIPLRIPVGVRISARMQASTASNALIIAGNVHAGVWYGPVPYSRVVNYGANLATSRGISIDAGATANTKPATWTTIGATTTEVAHGIIIGLGNQNNTLRNPATWLIDVGVGAAASEQALITNYIARGNVNEMVTPVFSPFLPCRIPQGSRIAMRAQCTSTTSTDRTFDGMIYVVV